MMRDWYSLRRVLLAIGIVSAVGMAPRPHPITPKPILTIFMSTLSTSQVPSPVTFRIERQMESGGWQAATNVTALPVPVLIGNPGDRFRFRTESGTNFSEWTTQP